MGYFTDYDLNINTILEPERHTSLADEIERMNVFDDRLDDYGAYTYSKWYCWEEDMLHLSMKFPEVLFELHGEGEDRDDMWDAYIQNGAIQVCRAEITYPKYDPNKMQKILSAIDPEYEYSYS